MVLIVAERETAKAFRDVLGVRCHVTSCTDARRGLSLAAAGAFDVVVVDDDIPGVDRLDVQVVHARAGDREGLLQSIEEAVVRGRRRLQEGDGSRDDLALLSYREFAALARRRVHREYLVALMRVCGGSVTSAAEHAEIKRESMHRLLKRYGVHAEDFRKP